MFIPVSMSHSCLLLWRWQGRKVELEKKQKQKKTTVAVKKKSEGEEQHAFICPPESEEARLFLIFYFLSVAVLLFCSNNKSPRVGMGARGRFGETAFLPVSLDASASWKPRKLAGNSFILPLRRAAPAFPAAPTVPYT